jgi:hypothetical protein
MQLPSRIVNHDRLWLKVSRAREAANARPTQLLECSAKVVRFCTANDTRRGQKCRTIPDPATSLR